MLLKKNTLYLLFSIFIILSFALTACGGGAETPAAEEPAAEEPAAEEPAAEEPAAEEPEAEEPAEEEMEEEMPAMEITAAPGGFLEKGDMSTVEHIITTTDEYFFCHPIGLILRKLFMFVWDDVN